MKVLVLIQELHPYGGTARKLESLFEKGEADYCVYVYSPWDTFHRYRSELARRFANVTIHEGTEQGFWSQRTQALEVAGTFKPDVVLGNYLRGSLLAESLASELDATTRIGTWYHGSVSRPSIWRRLAERMAVRRLNFAIYNSHYTRRLQVRRCPGLAAIPGTVIHNGVSPRPGSAPRSKSATRPQLAYIGAFLDWRNHAVLVDALSRCRVAAGDPQLVLVGPTGPTQSKVLAQIRRLRLEERITITGATDDIGSVLARTQIYLNPATDEAFGVATVEAMLAGLPVIASRAGALPEVVEDGVSGFLVSPDANEWARAIERLSQDQILRQAMGRAALERAQDLFNPDRFAKAVESFMRQMINSHAR